LGGGEGGLDAAATKLSLLAAVGALLEDIVEALLAQVLGRKRGGDRDTREWLAHDQALDGSHGGGDLGREGS
jgi:hypothetical protein